MLRKIVNGEAKMGLKGNQDQTKIMRIGIATKKQTTKIGNYEFDEVNKFKYLGLTLTKDGDRHIKIKEKVITANKAFYVIKKLKPRLLEEMLK